MAANDNAKTKDKSEKKKRGASKNPNPNQPNPLVKYFRETRGELRKVTWPTRQESWRLTWIVLAVTIAFAIALGLMDAALSELFELLIDLIV